MYTALQLAAKYLRYYRTASNGKGHGVHSPFVFDFIKNVLRDKTRYKDYASVEALRKKLLSRKDSIEIEDFGAGSTTLITRKRAVKDVAATSLKPKKYAQLLYRIAKRYNCNSVVELGTSFGITTSYLAAAGAENVTSFEGSPAIAAIAKEQFKASHLQNVKVLLGNMDDTIPRFVKDAPPQDLFFLDGNHRKEPTLLYFEQLLTLAKPNSIFIIDDIHWSEGMEEAWGLLKSHKAVTLSLDLFFIGILFVDPSFLVKQSFTIRF